MLTRCKQLYNSRNNLANSEDIISVIYSGGHTHLSATKSPAPALKWLKVLSGCYKVQGSHFRDTRLRLVFHSFSSYYL